ncbi:MAG: hypothetical protein G01um10148_662 [Parcubacteria group bacterium Gr01-1014_8]|nr:MAG: hypothetical protein G01um10148_662 [Parcubacteria group bacterium Gr01-1014_8]
MMMSNDDEGNEPAEESEELDEDLLEGMAEEEQE